MNISYLQNGKHKNETWQNITRDERFFCFELYQQLKSEQKGLLTLIKEGIVEKSDHCYNERINFLKNIDSKVFDIGVEVCFYRDLLKWNDQHIGETELPQKRTFDLALFSEEAIIVIEAKAQQGFDTKQLSEFAKDRKHIEILFKHIDHRNVPAVYIIGLHSNEYTPNLDTVKSFDSMIKWKDLAAKYPASKELFGRADKIYRK